MNGYLSIVLHSHLPYVVTHGVWPHGLDWLNECCAETYIPLLDTCNQLVSEGISPKFTIGLTPVLCEQLADPAFIAAFPKYLDQKIESAVLNADEFMRVGDEHRTMLAGFWRDYYRGVKTRFKKTYGSDIVGAFKSLQDAGDIEIITSCATHGYLPLLSDDTSVNAQIAVGKASYERHFGRPPSGIWLPECAYRPGYSWKPPLSDSPEQTARDRKGVEYFVGKNGIQYFFVDSHLLQGGKAMGTYLARFDGLKRLWEQIEKEYVPREKQEELSPYNAHWVGSADAESRVAFFTRDPKTGLQVWSGEWGYPGSPEYLDFHKKHFPGGHRYWRVTDAKCDLGDKEQYNPAHIEGRLKEQADHFRDLVVSNLAEFGKKSETPGAICAPFDAELFGHWWFEGTRWLYHLAKAMHKTQDVSLITCSEYLGKHPPQTVVDLPEGSWGEGGFHYIWLNKETEWTWRHIYRAEAKMKQLAQAYSDDDDATMQRVMRQLARELLLLQSSDWQFLISTLSAKDYAEQRFSEHDANFNRLTKTVENYAASRMLDESDLNFLEKCEATDPLFPDIDVSLFAQ
ncbi:DUF1957 domain-containing protein [bacterium]|nr:DUF1957 domain-containing protein [bacterium]